MSIKDTVLNMPRLQEKAFENKKITREGTFLTVKYSFVKFPPPPTPASEKLDQTLYIPQYHMIII